MEYIIEKHEEKINAKSYDDIREDKYLKGVELNQYGFPIKHWTDDYGKAMRLASKEHAKQIVSLIAVNSSYPLVVKENETYPFNLNKHKKDVESGKAKLFFHEADGKDYGARIICYNRLGSKNNANQETPLVVLVTNKINGESIVEITKQGEAYTPCKGSFQALYVTYEK